MLNGELKVTVIIVNIPKLKKSFATPAKTRATAFPKAQPLAKRWNLFLASLPSDLKSKRIAPLAKVMDTFGLYQAIASLKLVPGRDQAIRLFIARLAKISLPLFNLWFPGDERISQLLAVAENYCLGLVTKKELKKAKQALEKLSEAIALDDRMTNYKFDELIFIISLARTCLDYSLFLDNDRDIGYIYHDCSQSIFYYIKNSIMIEDVEANELLNQVDPLTAVFTAYATDPFFDPSQSKFYDLLSDNFSSLSVKIQKILTEINLKIEVDFLKPAISHSIWAKFHQNFVKTILNLFVDEILNSVVKTEFLTLCALNGIYSSVSER